MFVLRKTKIGLPDSCGCHTRAECTYDVYCFGKVLLELVTGKLGISEPGNSIMKDWLEQILPYISIYDKEVVTTIIDPSLIIDEDLLEEVWAMTIVAGSCLNPNPSRRPLMRYILKALKNPLKVMRGKEETSSSKLKATSSTTRSWNADLFGNWQHSSSDVAVVPPRKIWTVYPPPSLSNEDLNSTLLGLRPGPNLKSKPVSPPWIEITVADGSKKENIPPPPPHFATPAKTRIEQFDALLAEKLNDILQKLERMRFDKEKTEKLLKEREMLLDLQMNELLKRGEEQKHMEIKVDLFFQLKEL